MASLVVDFLGVFELDVIPNGQGIKGIKYSQIIVIDSFLILSLNKLKDLRVALILQKRALVKLSL